MLSRKLSTYKRNVCRMLFWAYHNCISPFLGHSCRFYPTCSAYARDAVLHFGILKGGYFALRRLFRCHPLYRGPLYDPVWPQTKTEPETQEGDEIANG